MKKIFKITNHTSEIIGEDEEVIGVGFANNGEFAMLNNCTLDYDTLTTNQKTLVDNFLDLMRTKMLTCDSDGDGIPDSDDES